MPIICVLELCIPYMCTPAYLCAWLQDVATQLKGQLTVVKIDTDKYTGIASQHRIQVRVHLHMG